ncbi:hypothetical protein GP486_006784 [Trichoglossum hirsutum]|uniref:Aminoglycoside phosphotransferase domain-containing protein n=1 Tax=Trichoglossum hirsutum TaxID=265104 RepID=A0A9P8L7R1_9PEZI|nr:hypothetical protein GP486_006784 [Trichoglossum hirsutum]
MAKNNPLRLGSFIIIEFLDGIPLGEVMKNANEADLKAIYRQISRVLLDLSGLEGNLIGSLTLDDNSSTCLSNWPLTRNLNELFRLSNIRVDMPKGRTFGSSVEYAVELCNHHFTELRSRPNDDNRVGSAACNLVHNTISRFVQDGNRFTLVCDDLGPGNMLWKDGQISGLFDLEFSYFAPPIFNCVTLDWLVSQDPRGDSPELDFLKFLWFLDELEQVEKEKGLRPDMSNSIKRSLDDNTFWYIRALKSTFRIDHIYLKKLQHLSAMYRDAVNGGSRCNEKLGRSREQVKDAIMLGFFIGTAILSVYLWRRRG